MIIWLRLLGMMTSQKIDSVQFPNLEMFFFFLLKICGNPVHRVIVPKGKLLCHNLLS